jgi:hypothetical protein
MSTWTYILGRDAIFNQDILNAFEMFGAEFRRQKHLASWRILHVDGFESTPRLPQYSGRQIQFFTTTLGSCGGSAAPARTTGVPAVLSAPYGGDLTRTGTATFGIPKWGPDADAKIVDDPR